jgi:hypothetical protein
MKISPESATIRIKKIICLFMVTGVLATVILSIDEVLALMNGSLQSQGLVLSNYFIKSIKDVIFVLLLLIGFFGQLYLDKRHSKFILIYYFVLIALLIFSLILGMQNPALVKLSGLRWFMPFILPFFIYHFIDANTISAVIKPLQVVFLINFSLQIIQLFTAYNWYGLNSLGFSARSPGVFLIPGTAAAFTVMTFYMTRYYNNTGLLPKFAITWLCFISVMLTESAMGIIVLFILLALLPVRKNIIWLIPVLIAIVAPIVIYVYLNINSRGIEMLSVSGGVRLNILLDAISNAGLFSSMFGYGTNTVYLITGDGLPTDSTYAAIIVNHGIFGLAFFITILAVFFVYSMQNKLKSLAALIIIIALFSLSTNISETYPLNLLTVLAISFFIHQGKSSLPNKKRT